MDKEYTVVEEFYRLLHRVHQFTPVMCKNSDLSNVEFFMLLHISFMVDHGMEEITLGDIIKCTNMSMSAASKKISILEKKGFISRISSKKDKRNINIILTDKGKKVCAEERRKKHEWITEVLSEMGETDAGQLFALQNKMFDIIEKKEDKNVKST